MYIGITPAYGDMKSEVFSGNNSLTSFALTGGSVANDASILVSISGVTQHPGTDYSVGSLVNLIFTTAPPTGSSNILVIHLGRQVDIGTPGTGAVGIAQLSATGTPSSATALKGDNTWGTAGGPSLGVDAIIRTNAKVIAADITFLGSENGMTAGPITINSGITVTVTSGSTWTIV